MSDDHQDDTIELDSNESLPSPSEKTSTSDVDVTEEDDEDPEDALRTLSNMKRYKINNLCCQNLYEVGWSKLGANMEEDRRWTQMLQTQEREQIKDAVDCYITNQEQRNKHRLLTLDKSNPTMRWELDLRNAKIIDTKDLHMIIVVNY